MAIRKAKDEVGLRQPRDAKGRFVAKPIKPLPVNMRPQISKWADEDKEEEKCECGCSCKCNCTDTNNELVAYKFSKFQNRLNPKKDCKDVFEEAHNMLITNGGMLSKVINRNTNKPYGYLIRIPSATDSNVVFMRFVKHDEFCSNTYFQKANAIISTLICGERWLEKRNKRGEWIDDIPFCIYYLNTKNFLHVSDFGITSVQMPSYLTYVQGRVMNEAERAGYTLSDEMIDYISRFEQKAREYYKNNGKNKKFIALPFT
jgi:hypothetical protein